MELELNLNQLLNMKINLVTMVNGIQQKMKDMEGEFKLG
jgi:hypothetical protein